MKKDLSGLRYAVADKNDQILAAFQDQGTAWAHKLTEEQRTATELKAMDLETGELLTKRELEGSAQIS